MQLSPYQSAIADWFINESGHAAINAVAGSGKTTTLVNLASMLSEEDLIDSVFCAFNKSIQEELSRRLPSSMTVKTIHALGLAAIKNTVRPKTNEWIDDTKYSKLCGDIIYARGYSDKTEMRICRDILKSAVTMSQLTLVDLNDEEAFYSMCMNYNIEHEKVSDILSATRTVINRGAEMVADCVSFTDMIFLPVYLGIPIPTFGYIFVDEAQDLSNAQRVFVSHMLRPDSRLIAVGDPRQAIYGFAGAGIDSFDRIVNHFSAKVLPLSVCYRCAKSIVDMAKEIVPEIESAETADAGEIEHLEYDIFSRKLKPNDMVICRINAPLTSLAFDLIGRGIPAKIKGRDIMTNLITTAQDVHKLNGCTWENFPEYLNTYRDIKVEGLKQKKNSENAINSLLDRVNTLHIIYNRAVLADRRISSIDGLQSYIDRIYGDDTRDCVTLSSVHKAKGLEAEHVYILGPELMPFPTVKSEWALEQEYNLKYVAITRAKKKLSFVALEDKR